MLRERYALEHQLSEGGSATVWLARDRKAGNGPVAIKGIRPAAEQAVEQFRNEARLLMALDHPGIVAVLDSFSDQGTEYLVVEWMPNPSLREVLTARGRISPLQVVRWGRQLCE